MPSQQPIPLADKVLGDFFLGLTQLIRTGMPMEKALAVLTDTRQPKLANAIQKTAALVSRGKPLSVAGRQSGLFRKPDFHLLQVGENAGNLVDVTQALASQYAARATRSGKVRSRLMLPLFVLVVGVLIAPVPGLFNGQLDAAGYMIRALLPLALLALGVRVLIANTRNSRSAGVPSHLDRVLELFPAGKALSRDVTRLELLENLGLYLHAGVDAQMAFSWTIEGINHPRYRASFRQALTQLQAGSNVSDALKAADILDESGDYPVISAGEHAGKLEESILHRASWHREDIEQRFNSIAEWIPRILYGLVVAWVVTGFFA